MTNSGNAVELLRALVDALDSAFISSWQSTAAWDAPLENAREYLREQGEQHVL